MALYCCAVYAAADSLPPATFPIKIAVFEFELEDFSAGVGACRDRVGTVGNSGKSRGLLNFREVNRGPNFIGWLETDRMVFCTF